MTIESASYANLSPKCMRIRRSNRISRLLFRSLAPECRQVSSSSSDPDDPASHGTNSFLIIVTRLGTLKYAERRRCKLPVVCNTIRSKGEKPSGSLTKTRDAVTRIDTISSFFLILSYKQHQLAFLIEFKRNTGIMASALWIWDRKARHG